MKNFTILKTPEEIENFVKNLWASPIFQAAHDHSPYLRSWIEKFKLYPRFFGDMTDAHVERANFTPWFNLILHRQYPNPYIQDLFYLHEIIHVVTMNYQNSSWETWRQKMFDNEMLTSLETEVNVYQQLPNLRPHSFNFPIWADTVLADGPKTLPELISLRQHALLHPQTPAEEVIRSYSVNNEKWASIWRERFEQVEWMMFAFYQEVQLDPELAVANYQKALAEFTSNQIPFETEARAFAAVYWQK